MKKIVFLFGLFLVFSCNQQKILTSENQFALQEIKKFQNELINEWNQPETTPLKENEKAGFQGIHFFPIDLKYRINADFSPIKNGTIHPFPTSANRIKQYKEYGKINFSIDNQAFELTIYQSDPPIKDYESSLFLPFFDETNGETSYGGGRYLDLEISDIQNGKILIDFNQAYNPYCTYSNYYNCPIPPANNYLETEIKAGVSYKQ